MAEQCAKSLAWYRRSRAAYRSCGDGCVLAGIGWCSPLVNDQEDTLMQHNVTLDKDDTILVSFSEYPNMTICIPCDQVLETMLQERLTSIRKRRESEALMVASMQQAQQARW